MLPTYLNIYVVSGEGIDTEDCSFNFSEKKVASKAQQLKSNVASMYSQSPGNAKAPGGQCKTGVFRIEGVRQILWNLGVA